MLLVLSLAVALVGWEALAQNDSLPPSRKGKSTKPLINEQERTAKILNFLVEDYAQLWGNKEPLTRILAAMSIARISQPKAIDVLVRHIAEDPSPISSLVAWECLLSLTKNLTQTQYERWISFTPKVYRLGIMNGNIRVGLLKVMATTAPTKEFKQIFTDIFNRTNSLNPEDIPTLIQMGKCLSEWKSPDLVEMLISKMQAKESAYRAELVLHEAGCSVPWAGERMDKGFVAMWTLAIQDYMSWWRTERSKWVEKTTSTPDCWKKLDSLYLHPKLMDKDKISPQDKELRSELERDPPTVAGFDLAFVVDVTGSMRPAVDWLMEDMRRTMNVLRVLANRPRIGVTVYMDKGEPFVTKSSPLTTNVDSIIEGLAKVICHGGGDPPEAVWEGLQACRQESDWDTKTSIPKTMVLVGDAPPHPETMENCKKLLADIAGKGFHFDAVRVVTPKSIKDLATPNIKAKLAKKLPYNPRDMLPEFDTLAKAANGSVITVDFVQENEFEFRGKAPEQSFAISHVRIAKAPTQERPSKELLQKILGETITPKYKGRLMELIPLLVEAFAEYRPEKRGLFLDHKPQPRPHKGGHGRGGGGGGRPQQ